MFVIQYKKCVATWKNVKTCKTGHVRFSNGRQCPDLEWCSDFKWSAIFRQNGSHLPFKIRPPKCPVFEWFRILNGRISDPHFTYSEFQEFVIGRIELEKSKDSLMLSKNWLSWINCPLLKCLIFNFRIRNNLTVNCPSFDTPG